MSILPEIGTGRLVTSGVEHENNEKSSHRHNGHRKTGNKSLLEISQNLQSVHHDGKKLRSRSYEPSSDDNNNHVNKKAKMDRSKSLGNVQRPRDQKRKQPVDMVSQYPDENRNPKSKSPKRSMSGRRVRFDSNSDDSIDKKQSIGEFGAGSLRRPQGIQYKFGNRNTTAMESSATSSGDTSPTVSVRRGPPGSHQSRLEAARARAKIWTETHSDPGPVERSIDNDKVLRGQPIDPRRGKFQTDTARAKHAQFMNQDKQDGRPKAADKGRRLQSLPSKKESHVSETEERPVISAPSKDQGKMDGPMPKINTLVPNDSKASASNPSQPGTSKSNTTSVSPAKSTEPTVSPTKPKDPIISPRKVVPENKPAESAVKTDIEKQKDTRRSETKVTGVAGRTTKDEDTVRSTKNTVPTSQNRSEGSPTKLKDGKHKLPADDHGPAYPSPKPANDAKPSVTGASKNDPNFNYYASETQKALGGQNVVENSPRVPSEKSSKTDKSWVTIKTKNTQSSQPSGPVKSRTTVEFSQNSSIANSDKKRREVTIVDPKYVRRMNQSGDDDGEPFMHEYEFSHNQIKHHKDFKDMTDEEKINYFQETLHMKPDQIRELTFHPKVTEQKMIHHAYTGIDTVNWQSGRLKSGKRPKSKRYSVYKKVTTVPPAKRKSFMLSQLQGKVYRHINKVYDSSPRDAREKQFYEKLAQIQIEDMQHRYEMLAERERRQLEAKYRQREQLRRVRRKFEDDAWRRFMTQYVTSKVVEAELSNREEYGLPNHLHDGRSRNPYAVQKANSKKARFVVTPRRMQKTNQKKYATIFKYNAGPVPKVGGKPLKFEGFDTVYLDTEDENGKPTKKRQNVQDLMEEARRILDQSDDDTDLEVTPRKSQPPARRSRAERPQHSRSRNGRHIRDDKSYKSSQSKTSQASQSTRSKPIPRTMKDLLNQRRKSEAPVNRYKASNFTSMKADLLKDSNFLNKNDKLKKPQSELQNVEVSSKPEPNEKQSRDKSPEKEPTIVKTADKPFTTDASPVKTTTTVTTTQVSTVKTETTTADTNDTDEKKEWKIKEGNVFLDNMETQMAIETARDHIDNRNSQKDAPSRLSNHTDIKLQNGHSPKSLEKPASRTPSRISFRNKQEQSTSDEQRRPPRAHSRSSLFTTEIKPIKPPSRAPSRVSLNPINEIKSQGKKENDDKTNVRTETVFVTETVTETVNGSSSNTQQKTSIPGSKQNVRLDSRRNSISSLQPQPLNGFKEGSRRNSIISTQNQKHVSGRTSVVGIATNNGRVSPAIEKQRQPANNIEKDVNRQNKTTDRKTSISEKTSVLNGDVTVKTVTNNIQRNDNVSTDSKQTNNDNSSPKKVVTKSVNVSEDVTENVIDTHKTSVSKNKQVHKPDITDRRRSDDNSNRSNNDARSRNKPSSNHSPESKDVKENPKHGGEIHKKESSKTKKTPAGRRSRSRTPQRKQSMNGTGDIKMNMDEYEKMGHDGKRPSRRSGSKERGSNGRRRRSTSGGRKASKGGRKRSRSSERKKSKSRFPDINKQDGKWKITARSPSRTVERSEDVNEYTTERVITPKPAGANQWKDLVEKYLRQPSPKVGRTEDRSLLDSNITDDDDDDDDEMDIFKRAQMKYQLSVGKTDDEDSDMD
ncbi:uncharacterized protein LOC132728934 isoform X2 [Ruditapes philippinarum]|uniref:uncharacterized protein LOC132728934 isoform X2 n=1 Tax=Ruditapes philippinarum TaxID=129788 RepID=UPI00295AD9B4|nr:uncharacterized protein LOC132728934 isoform X2 [Ruditapes philippinarum]